MSTGPERASGFTNALWASGVLVVGIVSTTVLFGAALFVADRLRAREPLWFAQWAVVVLCPYVLCAVPILLPSRWAGDRRFVRWATLALIFSQMPAIWWAVDDVRGFDGKSPAMIGYVFVACCVLCFFQYPLALAALATTARGRNSASA